MKTHAAAVVLIPPAEAWEPIQAIRRVHDEHFRRWMPHITLIYPFLPPEEWPGFLTRIEAPLGALRPFEVRLESIRIFHHGPRSATLWLAPTLEEPILALQAALQSAAPVCNDAGLHAGGFKPHLSIGQSRGGRGAAERLRGDLQASWRLLSFTVRAASIIGRGEPPDDVFRVERELALGGTPGVGGGPQGA